MNREKKLANFSPNIQSSEDRRIDCVDDDLYITLPSLHIGKSTHYYCLNQGRHSGNFYLKLGAAGKNI